MRMPFKSQVPESSRLTRMRSQAQARAVDAAQAAQSAAGAAQSAAVSARSAAQSAATSVAGIAQNAATVVNERGRPVAMEAAARSAAAFQVLRHGVPRTGLARLVPASMGARAGRTRGPLMLMAVGGVGAAGVLAWRRSRNRDDELWIVDVDDDARVAAEGWDQGSMRSSSRDNQSGASSASDRMDHPSRRWP